MSDHILIVDDDPLHTRMLATLIRRKLDIEALSAADAKEALSFLNRDEYKGKIKLAILDLNMPGMDGLSLLKKIKAEYPALPAIMLTGSKDINNATQAMKLGAADYLCKPYESERMANVIKNALKISLLTTQVEKLKQSHSRQFKNFDQLIGHNQGLSAAVNIGKKAAQSDAPILILGQTGTGKEVFAQALHMASPFSAGPFIAINCGAIPSQLVESTLFGHEEGAFTGATKKTIGKFREADGGTIFLDEVGELPLETQVKLLRVLQEKEVEPVGATRAEPINVRVISATNKDLSLMTKDGQFREDLFYRLNGITIPIPPLSSRAQDINVLAQYFALQYSRNYNRAGSKLSQESLKALVSYHWPGNVRELENTIQRALILGNAQNWQNLLIEDIAHKKQQQQTSPQSARPLYAKSAEKTISFAQDEPTQETPQTESPSPAQEISTGHYSIFTQDGAFKPIDQIEQEIMALALEQNDDSVEKAAHAIGIPKSTFYRKISAQKKQKAK